MNIVADENKSLCEENETDKMERDKEHRETFRKTGELR